MLIPLNFKAHTPGRFIELFKEAAQARRRLHSVRSSLHDYLYRPKTAARVDSGSTDSYNDLVSTIAFSLKTRFLHATHQVPITTLLLEAPEMFEEASILPDNSVAFSRIGEDHKQVAFYQFLHIAEQADITAQLTQIVAGSQALKSGQLPPALVQSLSLIQTSSGMIVKAAAQVKQQVGEFPDENFANFNASKALSAEKLQMYKSTAGVEEILFNAAMSDRAAATAELEIAQATLACIAEHAPYARRFVAENANMQTVLKSCGFILT